MMTWGPKGPAWPVQYRLTRQKLGSVGMTRTLRTYTVDEDDQMVGLYIPSGIVSHGVVVAEKVFVADGTDINGQGHYAVAGARGSAWQKKGPPLSTPPPKSELLELECYDAGCIVSSGTSRLVAAKYRPESRSRFDQILWWCSEGFLALCGLHFARGRDAMKKVYRGRCVQKVMRETGWLLFQFTKNE